MNRWMHFLRDRKTQMIVSAVVMTVLGAAIFAVVFTHFMPDSRRQSVALAEYKHQGRFDYEVRLRPNSAFARSGVEPGSRYVTALVEGLDVSFSYTLHGDAPAPGLPPVEYVIVATLQNSDLWSKEFVLVPQSTAGEGRVTAHFSVPIFDYMRLMDELQQETQQLGNNAQLTIEARVHALLPDAGASAEDERTFVQPLKIDILGDMVAISPELELTMPVSFSGLEMATVPAVLLYRRLAIYALAFGLLLLAAWLWISFKAGKTPVTGEEILAAARRKYGNTLVEVASLPQPGRGQKVIVVQSLDDLSRAGYELMRPMVVAPAGKGFRFAVIESTDGVRYEYIAHADATPAPDPVALEEEVSTGGRPLFVDKLVAWRNGRASRASDAAHAEQEAAG
jgi:hypothetical protein